MNKMYGFEGEVKAKYDESMMELFSEVFQALPLGATIVHELITQGGQRLKLAEPRAPGMQPRPAGTAVWVRPLSAASVSVFAAP